MTTKISALSTGTTANTNDKIPVERGGNNRYITPDMIGDYVVSAHKLGLLVKALTNGDLTVSNGAATRIQWDTVSYDPLSTITTGGSWVFTVPVTGRYDFRVVDSFVKANSSTWSVGNGIEIDVYKGASTFLETLWYWEPTVTTVSTTFNLFAAATVSISLTAADAVFLKLDNFSGAARKLTSAAGLEIHRVA